MRDQCLSRPDQAEGCLRRIERSVVSKIAERSSRQRLHWQERQRETKDRFNKVVFGVNRPEGVEHIVRRCFDNPRNQGLFKD